MKKGIVIGTIVAGVLAIGAATAAIVISKNNSQPDETKNTTIITMNAIEGTPYHWTYTIETPGIIEFVDEQTVKENYDIVGAPIQILYKFKGVNKGETKVTYEYASVVDDYTTEKITYKITVNEKREITSVEEVSHLYDLGPETQNAEYLEPGIEE